MMQKESLIKLKKWYWLWRRRNHRPIIQASKNRSEATKAKTPGIPLLEWPQAEVLPPSAIGKIVTPWHPMKKEKSISVLL